MPRFPISNELIINNEARITGTDHKHIIKVLRLKVGAEITLFDTQSTEHYGKIKEINKKEIIISISDSQTVNTDSPIEITLLQGMPKADKMDYIIEKATELGVYRIVPVITERSQIRDRDRLKRWERISLEASKQCGRTKPTIVENTLSFNDAIKIYKDKELPIILQVNTKVSVKNYIKNSLQAPQNIVLFVGPEGGFTDNEVLLGKEMGFIVLGLGPRVLRTETASVSILSILQYHYGDM